MSRTAMLVTLMLGGCGVDAASPPPPALPDGFWQTWGDGRAELVGYRLDQPRLDVMRHGEAVLNTVTEPFSPATSTKALPDEAGAVPALKQVVVRDLQAGIYDFNLGSATWLALDGSLPLGQPLKSVFSWQDWCGLTFEQLIVAPGGARHARHSYWEGEGDVAKILDIPAGAVFSDTLPVLVRGLVGDLLPPGEQREVPFLPTLLDGRFAHADLAWGRATLSRSAGPGPLETALGTLLAETWTVTPRSGPSTTLHVEARGERRLLGWERSDGERATITGSLRVAYWAEDEPGDEVLRARLGLSVPATGEAATSEPAATGEPAVSTQPSQSSPTP